MLKIYEPPQPRKPCCCHKCMPQPKKCQCSKCMWQEGFNYGLIAGMAAGVITAIFTSIFFMR